MSEKAAEAGVVADTTYTATIEFQNDWGTAITGVWVAYTSGSQDTVYLDKGSQNIPEGGTITIGKIEPRSGHNDYWTVTFETDNGQLWGTSVQFKSNLPNADETIQIEAEGKSNEIQIVSSKGTSSEDLIRL